MWDDYRLDITYYVKYPVPTLLAKYPITVIISDFYSMLIFFYAIFETDVGCKCTSYCDLFHLIQAFLVAYGHDLN